MCLAAVVLAACGGSGSDDDRAASVIHRLLLAAATDDLGALESYPGELPPDLPVEPPLYPDAELIVSSRQPVPFGDVAPDDPAGDQPQPLLYFIVLDTNDAREDVFAFYEETLDADPWQLETTFSTAQLDTLQFFSIDDADLAGAVSIASGGDDGRTSILISLQDAGAFLEQEPAFELPESLAVPKELPPDVPVYEGSVVTASAFFREPGNERFLLVLLTEDAQEDVVGFYRDRFEEYGWPVSESPPIGLETRIEFLDTAGDIRGSVQGDRFARDRELTEVRIQFQQRPAREPEGAEVPPADGD